MVDLCIPSNFCQIYIHHYLWPHSNCSTCSHDCVHVMFRFAYAIVDDDDDDDYEPVQGTNENFSKLFIITAIY